MLIRRFLPLAKWAKPGLHIVGIAIWLAKSAPVLLGLPRIDALGPNYRFKCLSLLRAHLTSAGIP